MSDADLVVVDHDRVVVASVGGALSSSNSARVGEQIGAAVPNAASGLVVDLSAMTYIDSAGVSALLALARRVTARHQHVRVVVPTDAVFAPTLRFAGVDRVMSTCPTLEAALTDIAAAEREARPGPG